MRIRPHKHPCGHCQTPTECCGAIEQEYDGEPEFYCVEYHVPHRTKLDFICDACDEQRRLSECSDCGAFGTEAHAKDCMEGTAVPV